MKYCIAVALLAVTALPVSASEVIRSVDEHGTITFSDRPVQVGSEVQTLRLDAPAPAADSLTESQREAQAIIDKANSVQQQRKAAQSEKAEADARARQELERARAELETARIIGEGDRQPIAGGGSKLTPEYQNRVQAAERRVEEAGKKLEQQD